MEGGLQKIKKKAQMDGPVKMNKAWAGSAGHCPATAQKTHVEKIVKTAEAHEPGATCRAVVNRPFKPCQVHYRDVTFVRQFADACRKAGSPRQNF
jgi:hypothetical protein